METIFITGASRGIGLELTRLFLTRGCKVFATYRSDTPPPALIELADPNLSLIALEVTDQDAISKLPDALANTPIDILINNAGVIGPKNQSLGSMDVQGWLETFAINSIAPLMISNALFSNLKLSDNPRIITISSQMGALTRKSKGMFAYRSSKAAVNKVMQVLSLELEEAGIIVCPVHPGWVKTDMGGTEADITAEASARGIADLAVKLTMADSGKFLTWEGLEHDW